MGSILKCKAPVGKYKAPVRKYLCAVAAHVGLARKFLPRMFLDLPQRRVKIFAAFPRQRFGAQKIVSRKLEENILDNSNAKTYQFRRGPHSNKKPAIA